MPSYETTLQTQSVCGSDYQVESLKDLQQFSDPDGLAERLGISSATWPLFGVIWPSGLVLADILGRYNLEGLKILELGCGLALASLVAHGRGGNITASDHHPLARGFLRANVALNRMRPMKFATCDWKTTKTGLGKFDLIIGSDLLYEPNHPGLLASFINSHAGSPATVIIVDPGRHQQGKFTRMMEGFRFDAHASAATSAQRDTRSFRGKVLTYTRKES